MNVVTNHEAIVSNFLLLQACCADGFLADLATQDLSSDVVLASKHQLHLVKDEIDLLYVLQRAIGLNLDLLNDLCRLVDLTISLIHLNQLFSSLRVLTFQENLTFGGRAQSIEHGEFFLTRWKLVLKRVLAKLDHISCSFLRLSSSLAENNEPFSQFSIVLLVESCLKLYNQN